MELNESLFSDSDVISLSDVIEKLYSIKTKNSKKKEFFDHLSYNKIRNEKDVKKRLNKDYYYIPVWIDKDSNKVISDFKFGEYFDKKIFERDKTLIGKTGRDRLDLVVDSMTRSYNPCVFTDDDTLLKDGEYDNKNNKIRYNWDTEIHALDEFFSITGSPTKDCLVYSKTLSDQDRFTYDVFRPEYDEELGKWTCRVKYSRCYGHYHDNTPYSEKWLSSAANSIGNQSSDEVLGAFRKISDGTEGYLRRFSDIGILRVRKSDPEIYTGPSLSDLDW